MTPVEAARRFYAEEIRAVADIRSDAVIEAFAAVPREHFLGPGPWQIARPSDGPQPEPPYRTTRDADPAHLYHNVLVAIDPARLLNNGQPTALATWIDAVGPRPGEHVVHVGAGVGYYSAVIATCVGAGGRVTAIEVDAELAARAKALLAPWPWVDVIAGDAAAIPAADAILVNAGCTRPRPAWLDAVGPRGGRIVLPLTAQVPGIAHGIGIMVRLTARGPGDSSWAADSVGRVGIYDCAGARDAADQPAIMTALRGPATYRSLLLALHDRAPTCVLHNATYCLSTLEP